MRRLVILILAMVIFVGLTASAVLAVNAHFVQASASVNNAGNLVVNFKIAGLGDSVTTTVTASANATALYACKNNGNNFPSDPKKQEVSGPVSGSGDFTSGRNGNITASLTLSPPPLIPTLDCPGNQHVVLVSVTYSNVQVSEPNAGTRPISGTFTAVLEPKFFGLTVSNNLLTDSVYNALYTLSVLQAIW
jgi:hypothetical protein